MDTSERAYSNGPGRVPPGSSSFEDPTSAASHKRISGSVHQPKCPGLLRRLAGHWRRIVWLCLVVSTPLLVLIWFFVQPTYEASSLLRIESASPQLFGTLRRGSGDGSNLPYLETQANLITSTRVLEKVVADPLVVNLPLVKHSVDLKTDLRRKLSVEIIDDANLIRVALESTEPADAATIVNAVVQSYLIENTRYNRSGNKELRESLSKQLEKLQDEIKTKKERLKELAKKGRKAAVLKPNTMLNAQNEYDPTQPSLSIVTPEQYNKLAESLIACDLEYLEAMAQLEAIKSIREKNKDGNDQPLSTTRLRELEAAVEKAKRKKIAYREYTEKMRVTEEARDGDNFDAAYLDDQIRRLQSREEQVDRNLEQLKFQENRDKYRVNLVDSASIPRIPTNNKRLMYMAAAPLVVFFLVFGMFLVREIQAGRVAARACSRDLD
jgi:capsular polysaccharide biosynthesis protein